MIGERHLYFVEPGGRAMRYTVGVGREEALNFRGNAVIGRKAEWPHWTPTADMISPDADLCALHGRAAGRYRQSAWRPARFISTAAIRTTYFRLHGTIEPETIGQKVSSGCIRLFNHDIIDLYISRSGWDAGCRAAGRRVDASPGRAGDERLLRAGTGADWTLRGTPRRLL